MDKKSFGIIISLLVVTFAITSLFRYYRPQSAAVANFDSFPLEVGQWVGRAEKIDRWTLELLNPKAIFSATYVNPNGVRIHLFFDFFSSEASFGGPHSPRNCLPGSGWVIFDDYEHPIQLDERTIPAHRFELRYEQTGQVMDFWYVTNFGETANDYVFRLYETISSLTLRPKDVAFIRIITDDNPRSLEALAEFEKLFVGRIYSYLPF